MYPCVVCERPAKTANSMCLACERSYDRLCQKDMTTISLIEWVATRAREALLKKLKTLT